MFANPVACYKVSDRRVFKGKGNAIGLSALSFASRIEKDRTGMVYIISMFSFVTPFLTKPSCLASA